MSKKLPEIKSKGDATNSNKVKDCSVSFDDMTTTFSTQTSLVQVDP